VPGVGRGRGLVLLLELRLEEEGSKRMVCLKVASQGTENSVGIQAARGAAAVATAAASAAAVVGVCVMTRASYSGTPALASSETAAVSDT